MLTALAPPEDTIATRLGVFALCAGLGSVLVLIGRRDVRTRRTEESGTRRIWLQLWGKSVALEGRRAVFMGVVRITFGIAVIVMGAVFLVLGPFLAK